jgi:hypothetical protein
MISNIVSSLILTGLVGFVIAGILEYVVPRSKSQPGVTMESCASRAVIRRAFPPASGKSRPDPQQVRE